jgi:hypothetical protein
MSALLFDLANGVPEGVTALVVGLTSVVALAVKAAKIWRSVQDARMRSVPPVAPVAPAQPHHYANPPPSGTIAASELQAHVSRAIREMQLTDLRDEMAAVRRDMAEVADDARRTAAALVKAQLQLDAAHAKIATLEAALAECQALALMRLRERDAAEARAQFAARELAAFKSDSQAGLSTQPAANITPLRPPRR